MDRRAWLIGSGLCVLGRAAFGAPSAPSLAMMAREGGVVLIRHTSTEPGVGDPPGFTLGQCSSQRNLSEAGRAEAVGIGAWFRQHGLEPRAVLSSQWCRCQDTARLAFGRYEDWPALNSTFSTQDQQAPQLQMLRRRLRQLPSGALEVWVTHQVIMTGLTGAYPAMGEGFLADAGGTLRARGLMRSGS